MQVVLLGRTHVESRYFGAAHIAGNCAAIRRRLPFDTRHWIDEVNTHRAGCMPRTCFFAGRRSDARARQDKGDPAMFRPLPRACALAALAFCAAASAAPSSTPIEILFVGDSYTFGRVDPVMDYNAANVHDLTAAFNAADSSGTNAFEPHPWGGVPGIFKEFTTEAGLNYDVSISARNAASLRGQFLDTRQQRVGPARQRGVEELERGGAAGPERRVAAGRQGQERRQRAVPGLREPVRELHPQRRGADLHRDAAVRLARQLRGGRRLEDVVRHQAVDPRQRERQPEHQDLSHRNVGAAGHGVPAPEHRARSDLVQRRTHRRHQRQRRSGDALLHEPGRDDDRPARRVRGRGRREPRHRGA